MSRTLSVVLRWGLAGLIALAFLVVMSPTTSIYNSVYGGDSAIFRVIGSALRDGQELYVDVWDHKGPSLFFIEWFGQLIYPGRVGIFVLQVIALTVSLFLVMSIARRFTSRVGTAGVLVLVLAVLSFTFEGGNLSEEFALPFTFFVLYGAVRVLADDERLRGARGFLLFALMGVAFAFTFFTRANNAIPIAGIFIGLLVQLVLRRAPFVKRFLAAVLGFFVMSALIVGWFALRGTLDDMLNATFWFNLRYVDDASTRPKALAYVLTICGAAVLTLAGIVGQLVRFGARRSLWPLGAALGLTSAYAVLSPTTSYAHYLTLIVPLIAFGAVMLLNAVSPGWRTVLAIVMLASSVATLLYQVPRTIRYFEGVRAVESAYEQELDDVLAAVPPTERDEVFPWSLPATFYLMTGTLPSHKYFITQPWWGSIDPSVPADTVDYIAAEKVKWVLTPASGTSDDDLQRLLDSNYVQVQTTDRFALFERE